MRITVVTTSYPAFDGDPSGHFVEAEVAELRAAGHAVTVVTPRVGGAFGWPGAAARLRQRPWRALDAGAWLARAALEVRASRADRIVAHWAVPSGWPAASAGARAELELVSHGADVRLIRAMPEGLRARVVRGLAARATTWRFVSRELLAELASALAAPEARAVREVAVVAPSPLGMIDVTEDVRSRRDALGARPLYVCAGRLVASKRVDKVIDYVATRPGRRELEPVLVVLGDGPERAHLEHLAWRWRLDARFLGTTRRREALSWIGAADEVVHASTAEGLSTVLREAEHLGVKVTIL